MAKLNKKMSNWVQALKMKIAKIKDKHDKAKLPNSEDDGIEDSNTQGFNDVMIEHTKERITQEFSNFASIETKSGIAIAIGVAVLTLILSSSSLSTYQEAFIAHTTAFFFCLGLGVFGFSIFFGLMTIIIIPRKKLDLLDPRKMNNDYNEFDLETIKRQIRHNLIQSFENLQKECRKETKNLLLGLIFLGIGASGFTLLYVLAH